MDRMSLADAVEINSAGWLWPKGDQFTWPTVVQELEEIPFLVELCAEKRICVQAGGNGGLWPDQLAKLFKQVYTFEPDPILFRCLVNNVKDENVRFFNAAVGSAPGFVEIDRWMGEVNPGANRVKQGTSIPVLTVDGLGLSEVDLIQFDIEGYELEALKGAEKTIERCRPVICLELRNHSHHFGTNDEAIRQWLRDRGYTLAGGMHYDEFWTPET
jgi:FkbM family methyltransferase